MYVEHATFKKRIANNQWVLNEYYAFDYFYGPREKLLVKCFHSLLLLCIHEYDNEWQLSNYQEVPPRYSSIYS